MGRIISKAKQQRRDVSQISQMDKIESDRINVIEKGMRKLKRVKGQPIVRQEAVCILNLYFTHMKRLDH